MTVPAYSVPERAEVTFVATRHETGDELEALGEGCRVAVAEELRRLANLNDVIAQVARVWLLQSANALDPEGATR